MIPLRSSAERDRQGGSQLFRLCRYRTALDLLPAILFWIFSIFKVLVAFCLALDWLWLVSHRQVICTRLFSRSRLL